MLKRLYHVLALLAMINLFAIAGLLGFLFASGRLNAERVDQIAVVLRGEFPRPPEPVATRPAEEAAPERSRDEIARIEARRKFFALIADRQQRELTDRQSLNQRIQFDVNAQMEQIQTKQEQIAARETKLREEVQQDGFAQALAMYSDMEPKLARDVLITKKDADVVQILTQMDPGPRKKIINSCKTAEEKAWIGRIMTQVRTLDEPAPPPASPGGA